MMNAQSLRPKATTYTNIMEILVHEEIERQIKPYPSHLKKYINKVEVATFALNRLPPLYASSQEGKTQQHRNGQDKYRREIQMAVRRGLAAVEKDPLRVSTPLNGNAQKEAQMAEIALQELQDLLNEKGLLEQGYLSWNNLTTAVYQALKKIASSRKKVVPTHQPSVSDDDTEICGFFAE